MKYVEEAGHEGDAVLIENYNNFIEWQKQAIKVMSSNEPDVHKKLNELKKVAMPNWEKAIISLGATQNLDLGCQRSTKTNFYRLICGKLFCSISH